MGRNIFSKHITREGKEIAISAMDDSHLLNCINLFCRQIMEAEKYLNNEISDRKTAASILYGKENNMSTRELKKLAESTIEQRTNHLPPYCMEAMRRPAIMASVVDMINLTFPKENEVAIAPPKMFFETLSLPNATQSEEDWWADSEVDYLEIE